MSYLVDDFLSNERTTGRLDLNGTVKGRLQKGYDADWFVVMLEAGVTYYLTGYNHLRTDGFAIGFFDPRIDDVAIAVGGGDDEITALEFTPAESGLYYAMAVDLQGGVTGASYSLHLGPRFTPDDFASHAGTAGVLTAGGSVAGVFEQYGDVDWFRFSAEAGYHYSFIQQGVAHPLLGTGVPSFLRIVDADGFRVETPGAGFNPLVSGDYFVEIIGGRSGGYSVSATAVRDDFAESWTTSGQLAVGGAVEGTIDFELDADWLRVDFVEGTYYTFHLQSAQNFVFGLTLRDADGERLEFTRSFVGAGLHLTYKATTTGPAFLEIDRSLTGTPIDYATPYRVTLASALDDIGQDSASARSLSLAAPAQGTLQMGSDRDAFIIGLEAGVTYRFALSSGAGSSYLKLELTGATDAAVLATKDVGANGGLEFTPSTTGNFLVHVASTGGIVPNLAYVLTAERAVDDRTANSAGAAQLPIGGSASGTLDNPADRDWFAVDLQAGATYWIAARSEAAGPVYGASLRILDSAGHAIRTFSVPWHEYPPFSFKPETGGRYYVEVSSPTQRTGTYSLSAAIGTPDDVGDTIPSAAPLAIGASVGARIEVGSDRDVFRLDVIKGETYEVKLGAWQWSVALSDASGNALAGIVPGIHQNSQLIVFAAQETGSVFATVQGMVGAYQIQTRMYADDITNVISASAPSLAEGTTVSGNLEHAADRDVFSIQLDAHRTYVIKIKSTQPGGAPPSVEHLRDAPAVPSIKQSVLNGERTLEIVTHQAGKYFLELRNGGGFGTYTVTTLPFAGDGNGPALVAQTHADNATGVSLTERTITLKFSEPIVVDRSAIVLRDSAGKVVTLAFGAESYPQVVEDTLIVKAQSYFTPGTYTLSIPSASIHDKAGNRYAGPESITFTTTLAAEAAGAGNDIYVARPGKVVDGGPGIDTFVVESSTAFTFVLPDGDEFVVWNMLAGTTDRIRNIERLLFSSQVYALDVDGVAGQAYRLYQAAFNRTPDQDGLGFWIGRMDHGVPLLLVAQAFVGNSEFQYWYGVSTTDSDFVRAMYQNVLHRYPDQPGLDFWLNAMDAGTSRAEVLVHFSESTENKDALADVIGQGFPVPQYGMG